MTDGSSEVWFNAKDGFRFARIVGGPQHGSVKVHVEKHGAVVYGTMLTSWEWASVVASVSALGETGTSFRICEALQKG